MLRLVVVLLCAAGVLAARFIVPVADARFFVQRYGYYSVALCGLLFFLSASHFGLAWIRRGGWRQYRVGFVVCGLGALFLQLHEPHTYKVLNDEFAICGVARNMHFQRSPDIPQGAHVVDGRLQVVNSQLDKRQTFFPFVLSVVHSLTGYRPGNVYLLNGLTALGVLLLVFHAGYREGGNALGALLAVLVAGIPLLAQNATGAGYDLLNMLMLGVFWIAATRYLAVPDGRSLNFLVLSGLACGQVRYESILIVLAVAAIFLLKSIQTRRIELTWLAAISPLLLLVPVLGNKVFLGTPQLFRGLPGVDFFSLSFLPENILRGLSYLFDSSVDATNSSLFSFLGSLCLCLLLLLYAKYPRQSLLARADDRATLVLAVFVGVVTFLGWSHFWGHWDDPAASRFSLPLHLLFALAIARVLGEIFKQRHLRWEITAVAALWGLVTASTVSARHSATESMDAAQQHRLLMEVLASRSPARTLVIADTVTNVIMEGRPGIPIARAAARGWQINECLRLKLYDEIVLWEQIEIDPVSRREVPSHGMALSADFVREPIVEVRLRPSLIVRASRLLHVKGEQGLPPKEYVDEVRALGDAAASVRHLRSILP